MGCEVTLRFAQEHTSVRSTLSPSAEINSGLRAVWGIWTGPGRRVIWVRRRVLKVLQCDNQCCNYSALTALGIVFVSLWRKSTVVSPLHQTTLSLLLKHINNTAGFFHAPPAPRFYFHFIGVSLPSDTGRPLLCHISRPLFLFLSFLYAPSITLFLSC